MQIVYNGSNVKIERPKIIEGLYYKDFGPGFYCTILPEQAAKWARKCDTHIVNKYEYRDSTKIR